MRGNGNFRGEWSRVFLSSNFPVPLETLATFEYLKVNFGVDLILPYCVLKFILVCVLVCCVARNFQDSINSTELDYSPTQLICAAAFREGYMLVEINARTKR